MAAEARVIDLAEYRQRKATQAHPPPPLQLVAVVWYPVWFWVPCWPV